MAAGFSDKNSTASSEALYRRGEAIEGMEKEAEKAMREKSKYAREREEAAFARKHPDDHGEICCPSGYCIPKYPDDLCADEKAKLQININFLNDPSQELSFKIGAIQSLYDRVISLDPEDYAYCRWLSTIPGLYKSLKDVACFTEQHDAKDHRTLGMLYDFISCLDCLPREKSLLSSITCFFDNKTGSEEEKSVQWHKTQDHYMQWLEARDQYRIKTGWDPRGDRSDDFCSIM